MRRTISLLLDVWREACKHIEIDEFVGLVAPLLARPLGAEVVLIRRLEAEGRAVDTLAIGRSRPGRELAVGRSDHGTQGVEELRRWAGRRAVDLFRAGDRGTAPRGLIPDEIDGDVFVGPLDESDGGIGLLIVAGTPGGLDEGMIGLVSALLEPFSVALENDRRLRELRSLREAVEAENRSLLSKLGRNDISESIVGVETGLKPVMDQVKKVARSDAPALVLGETGSGKEVVARAIHSIARRARVPFLRINCGAIPPELVDSELFGHERGSFTGAVGERRGWFERADGGTLFLDEVGELPPAAQVRLLRVLQDGMIERVGGEHPVHVDVRIVAATHRDLQAMVADGRFRQDLWYRIAVFPIRLPPLRDRPSDIPALAAHFALKSARRLGMPPLAPTAEDVSLLVSYSWPGNVRELAAVIERAAILGNGERLEVAVALGRPQEMPPKPDESGRLDSSPAGVPIPLDDAIARHIESALRRARGRIEGPHGAAALLRINPHTLRARMRKLGIDWSRFRSLA